MSQSNMGKGISAVVLPDLDHTRLESILRAALYFDKIYADSFSFEIEAIERKKEEKGWARAKVQPHSLLPKHEALRDLVTAGVILPAPATKHRISIVARPPVRDFPPTLRDKITGSLRAFASEDAYTVGLMVESAQPRKTVIKDPTNLSDPDAFVAAELFLLTVLQMLCVCESQGATPLTDHEARESST